MKNDGKKLFVFLVFAILSIKLAAAQTGCFTYQDSFSYCNYINIAEAKEECSLYDDCDLSEDFFPGERCNNLDYCKKILCKSTCKEEFSGKCLAGGIPQEKESEWCSSGCCRFTYSGGESCNFKSSKWLCEVDANNKNSAQFVYLQPLDELACQQKCQEEMLSWQESGERLVFESVSENFIAEENNEESSLEKTNLEIENIKEENKDYGSLIVLFVTLLLLLILMFFAFNKRVKRLEMKKYIPNDLEERETSKKANKNKKRWFDFLKSNPAAQQKITEIKSEHQQKVKNNEREEFFDDFGPTIVIHKRKESEHFKKLKRIVKHHKPKERKASQEKVFSNLDELVKVTKKNEELENFSNSYLKKNNQTKNAISELKSLFKKKE